MWGKHLIFLVHGLGAKAWMMRHIKHNLQYMFPESLVYSSIANEHDTYCSIREMGENLAEEVKE